MGIFGRMWRVIKGWLLIGVEKAEDPEVILTEAAESMRHEFEKAKQNAAEAIAARNRLRNVLEDQQKEAAMLEAKARQALKMGNEEIARQLLVEKATYDQNIEGLKGQLAQAEKASELVKQNLRAMEGQLRQRTAQRLALVAGWKQAKIQEQLNKAFSNISLDNQNQAFQRAEERIRHVQSLADARMELSEGGLQQNLAKLENAMVSQQADEQLAAMKAELGQAPQVQEDPLARLKAEIARDSGTQTQKVGVSADNKEENGEPPLRNLEV